MRAADLQMLVDHNNLADDRLLSAADRGDPAGLAAESDRPWGSDSGLLTEPGASLGDMDFLVYMRRSQAP